MDDFELIPPPDSPSYDARRERMRRIALERDEGVLFSQEAWDLVLDLIEDGYTTTEIDDYRDLPSWATIRRWMRADPSRRDQYRAAKEMSGDALESQLLGIARTTFEKDDVPAARLRADILKHTMARRSPRAFGDPRLIMEMSAQTQEPVVIKGGLPEMPMDD